jgi:glycerophosphoryl diester phosphodiesterase
MVENTASDIQPTDSISAKYSIVEQTLISKTDNEAVCEDAIYIGPHFIAVIDGVTSKTQRRWEGKTGGRIAAETIKEAFGHVPSDATARQAVDILTAAIQSLYKQYDVVDIIQDDAVQRAVACFVAISFERKEVWFVGDCQCMLKQELIQNTKEIDDITANARSLFLEAEIARGKTIEELREHDTGRAFILPLLERQMIFQNNPAAGQYWFPVIDGFDVPDEGIRVLSLSSNIETIVLASDGYPHLKDSLEASEQALQEILRDDPLLFRKYKATKGLQPGNVSFDDRAYVKIELKKEASEQNQ